MNQQHRSTNPAARALTIAERRFLTPAQVRASHKRAVESLARSEARHRQLMRMPHGYTRNRKLNRNRLVRDHLAFEVEVLAGLLDVAS